MLIRSERGFRGHSFFLTIAKDYVAKFINFAKQFLRTFDVEIQNSSSFGLEKEAEDVWNFLALVRAIIPDN